MIATDAGHAGQITTVVVACVAIALILFYAALCEIHVAMERAVWERDRDDSEAALIADLARMPDRLDEIADLERWV